jgi:MFS superfamily sulfate permease-like transporter
VSVVTPVRPARAASGNVYDLRELGGACGDLGTLVPFVVGYLTVTRLDPTGVLVAFGLVSVAAGLWYRTPMPVQPMKAIGTTAINHPALVTPGAVAVAALVTGLVWLGLGASGAASRLAALVGRPVLQGLVLGLGLALMLQATGMMAGDPLLAVVAMALALALMARPRVPAMLALLLLGGAVALVREPALLAALGGASWRLRLPLLGPGALTWNDALTGVLVLALPQAALTFGNAVVATVDENNTLFPDRPVTVRGIALDHGIMNVVAAGLGGVPMCHGAGGMAGHVRFGARTGGSLVMLGVVLVLVGLFLADSVHVLLRLFPPGVLGVILFLGGLELASGAATDPGPRADRLVAMFTAGLALWNVGVAFAAGLVLWYARRRGWLDAVVAAPRP